MLTQIRRNNMMSIVLLIMFPVIILATVWVFLALLNYFGNGYYNQYGEMVYQLDAATVNAYFLSAVPWVVGGVGLWFLIAYFSDLKSVV